MEKCYLCGEEKVCWSIDFSTKDLDEETEYEGIVSIYRCNSCGAEYEITKLYDTEEN